MIEFIELQRLIEFNDRLVTVSDARDYFGGCIPGWRTFSETFDFDWRETMRHGIPASKLLQTGDTMAINLISFVYSREVL